MLALALSTLAAFSQSPDLCEVVLGYGRTVGSGSNALEPIYFQTVRSGLDGGWLTPVLARTPGTGSVYAILGQVAGGPQSDAVELRRAGPVNGGTVRVYGNASLFNGQIAYVAQLSGLGNGYTGALLDDDIIYARGTVLPGTLYRWRHFEDTLISTSGTVVVQGRATNGPLTDVRIVAEWPSHRVLAADQLPLPSLPSGLSRVLSVATSPSGNHVAIIGETGSGLRDAVLLDGDVLDFGGGALALGGSAVPPTVAAAGGSVQTWSRFESVHVNDSGDVVLHASNDAEGWAYLVRNGLPTQPVTGRLRVAGIDAVGAVLTIGEPAPTIEFEGSPVMLASAGIDADGDGVPESNWSFGSAANLARAAAPAVQSLSLFAAAVNSVQPGSQVTAVMRARDYRIDRKFCDGVPNSTGRGAQMVASGATLAAADDVQLHVFQLPQFAPCLLLVADAPGFAANPGGSQGNLCLGGGIGRLVGQVVQSGASGTGTAQLTLGAVPTPNGPVVATAGQTWFAQAWYRDAVGGTATSNFSAAIAIVLD